MNGICQCLFDGINETLFIIFEHVVDVGRVHVLERAMLSVPPRPVRWVFLIPLVLMGQMSGCHHACGVPRKQTMRRMHLHSVLG